MERPCAPSCALFRAAHFCEELFLLSAAPRPAAGPVGRAGQALGPVAAGRELGPEPEWALDPAAPASDAAQVADPGTVGEGAVPGTVGEADPETVVEEAALETVEAAPETVPVEAVGLGIVQAEAGTAVGLETAAAP